MDKRELLGLVAEVREGGRGGGERGGRGRGERGGRGGMLGTVAEIREVMVRGAPSQRIRVTLCTGSSRSLAVSCPTPPPPRPRIISHAHAVCEEGV